MNRTALSGDSPGAQGVQGHFTVGMPTGIPAPVKTVRVAVIGAGMAGTAHAARYTELPHCQLRSVVDSDAHRARTLARHCGTDFSHDYHEILGLVDAVSIATPAATRFRIACDCLAAGLDVLMPYPIATRMDEVECLLELAAAQGRVLQVGQMERHNPATRSVSRLALKPRFLDCRRDHAYADSDETLDVLFDLMIQDIDLVLGLVDAPAEVIQARGEQGPAGLDQAEAWLRVGSDCEAHLQASRIASRPRRHLRLFEPGAYASLDLESGDLQTLGSSQLPDAPATVLDRGDALQIELASFMRCVRRRVSPRLDGHYGLRALALTRRVQMLIAADHGEASAALH